MWEGIAESERGKVRERRNATKGKGEMKKTI